MSELVVMDVEGDTRHMWDPNKQEEVEAARTLFNSFKSKGYIAYKVDKKGDKASIMQSFDQNEGSMILMSPPMVGG